MLLAELLKGLKYTGAVPRIEITDVTDDSRKAGENSLFVCIRGERSDGHDYAAAAVKKGCGAVVAERETGAGAPHIIVPDGRIAYSLICANFYGNPAKSLKLVGVTGTSGKTTTTLILRHILEYNGHKAGLIGTIKNIAGGEEFPAGNTTPEPPELQRLFRKMADAGCEYAVMEVSSQALAQERVSGCRFEASVFTNLSQDHLDYHKTMENYLAAKQKLFEQSDCGIINLDDAAAEKIICGAPCRTVTFSARNMKADYTARNIRYRPDGVDYDVVGLGIIGRVKLGVPGSFNVYNSLAAVSCAVTLGVSLQGALEAVHDVKSVKGRAEVVPTGKDFTVIIDFAHTPDELEKILKMLNGIKKGRLVALFGCGGDRDRTKRPKMGKAVADNADYAVITSDNPRTEDPSAIIRDILPGFEGSKTPYTVIENRREAIRYAIENARTDDVILLAGKGHETYQIIGTQKVHLDEREVVAEVLDGK